MLEETAASPWCNMHVQEQSASLASSIQNWLDWDQGPKKTWQTEIHPYSCNNSDCPKCHCCWSPRHNERAVWRTFPEQKQQPQHCPERPEALKTGTEIHPQRTHPATKGQLQRHQPGQHWQGARWSKPPAKNCDLWRVLGLCFWAQNKTVQLWVAPQRICSHPTKETSAAKVWAQVHDDRILWQTRCHSCGIQASWSQCHSRDLLSHPEKNEREPAQKKTSAVGAGSRGEKEFLLASRQCFSAHRWWHSGSPWKQQYFHPWPPPLLSGSSTLWLLFISQNEERLERCQIQEFAGAGTRCEACFACNSQARFRGRNGWFGNKVDEVCQIKWGVLWGQAPHHQSSPRSWNNVWNWQWIWGLKGILHVSFIAHVILPNLFRNEFLASVLAVFYCCLHGILVCTACDKVHCFYFWNKVWPVPEKTAWKWTKTVKSWTTLVQYHRFGETDHFFLSSVTWWSNFTELHVTTARLTAT